MKCIILVAMMAFAAANAGVIKTFPAPLEVTSHAILPSVYSYASLAYPAYRSLAISVPVTVAAPWGFKSLAAPKDIAIDVSEPTYVASNPGVTHVAPLPGHTESVISDNNPLSILPAANIVVV